MLATAGAAVLLLAWWLRNPLIPYGGETTRASGISADSAPTGAAASPRAVAIRALAAAIRSEEARLHQIATAAISAPRSPEPAFAYLKTLTGSPESGVLVEEGAVPLAWAGQVRPMAAGPRAGTFVMFSPFYTTLEVVLLRGGRRVVATAVLHAEPPANRVASALDGSIKEHVLVEAFHFAAPADSGGGELVLDGRGTPLVRVDAVPRDYEALRFAAAASARGRGLLLLALMLLGLITLAWRDRRSLGSRLFAIAVGLVSIALIPWNNFSNYARVFDPAYFYSQAGGPLTASAGGFAMFGVLLVLGVIALIRAQRTSLNRHVALMGALVLAAAGLVIAQISAGAIVLPPAGASLPLWLAWEIPLFLVVFACWLAALWLGRRGFGRRPMVKLRSAAFIGLIAAAVATFVVWTRTTEQRLQLAMRDVAGLQRMDSDVPTLLTRFSTRLASYETAGTRADLLKRYALSDLPAAQVHVSLGLWSRDGMQTARLDLAQLPYDSAALSALVRESIAGRRAIMRQTFGPVGRQLLLAVPHADGLVTSVVASPRTRLVAQDPYAPLLGLGQSHQVDPPYALTLADVLPGGRSQPGTMTWRRIGDEWHGDEIITTSNGLARAHVEVDLRAWPTRLVRAALLVLLDIAVATLLWALSAIAEGGFARWLRGRATTWVRSYRGRLTLALFTFFVFPAIAFAAWSYQRLRGDDRDVRQLLVRETLHAAAGENPIAPQLYHSRGETPLFLYSNSFLVSSTDSLYEMIAPAGRLLPRPVQLSIADGGELTSSWQQTIAGSRIFWGFRAASSPVHAIYVLAAPARSDEVVLDRRRRDLTLLVLFATAMGAIAAFWLSGIAARILARDLELSRIEVARAERVLAWGEMARQVAHEIKNPLTPIRLGVQHLRRARTDPRIDFDRVLDENVTRILGEIDRLDEIARAFSRYGSAPADLPPAEPVDAAAILRDVVGLERMGIGGVSWVLRGAEAPAPAFARGDELRDVLLNVFENARLARAREVAIELTRTEKTLVITIVDNGGGIPETALPRVFEPHFSTRTTGSGLGLAISRRLLESWGGTIDLESQEGRGARVVITLQAAPA
ncbi:MAG TPA: ATP-binding protein [Gemmatimonadaceae bacterium]|nr:ATP-binding protein [Gemmatimonadaceae bacterium]